MCGIAGILRRGERPVDPWRIPGMCDAIAHRGPDDAGYAFFSQGKAGAGDGGYWVGFVDERFRTRNEHLPVMQGDYARHELPRYDFDLALGHRRLSVLDLSHYGHQPMASSDRRLWVSYNGEIYNFRELRSELEARGRVFRTRSDTEVLLHMWEVYGADALERLDGMFAFAVFDRVRGRLHLARDRFGVKPLYYAETNGYLVFASEPKAILASGLVTPAIDPASLVEYLTFQNLFGDRILLEGIQTLGPGEHVEVSVGESRKPLVRTTYHAGFPRASDKGESLDEAAARVSHVFQAAVERQLVSDVPVGSYLSGGMDSGSIVAVAGKSLPRLTTFTGGFDLTNVSGIEQGFDERPEAERLSHLLQTEHYAVVLHAGDMPAAMERITWHVDDPRLGMCHQNWYVAKLASKFVKVCLAGAGGDELFGGYPWRYRRGVCEESVEAFDNAYFDYWHRLVDRSELQQLLSPDLRGYSEAVRGSFEGVMKSAPDPDPAFSLQENLLQRALHFELKTFLHGFLQIEDRISMAHSMESRVPFLDNALADLAFELAPFLKVQRELFDQTGDGHLETAEGKWVLRRAMEDLLPREFTQMRKQGFSPPDENWFRGPSMSYVKEILHDRQTESRPWFDAKLVRRTLDEHFEGRHNHRLLIWSLLSVEWLQRHFIDGGGITTGGGAAP
jgi:asparagine synthase (glutamine-hydrolysing)